MWPSNECKLPKLARKSSEALVYKMSACIFHFMVKLKKNSLIVAKIRRYVWAHVRACVGGCLGLPLFSDVVLSACPASWDREQEIKMKKKKKKQRATEKCRRLLRRLAAEMPVCFVNIPAGSQMWALYLWIARWRHGPLPPLPHTRRCTYTSAHNTVPKKEPAFTTKKSVSPSTSSYYVAVGETVSGCLRDERGNRPLGCQRTPAHPVQNALEKLTRRCCDLHI